MSATRLAKAAIKIPMRIERGPTDILKALSSTVKHIPGQPDISLQDDPLLLPRKHSDFRMNITSKLYGKRLAKFLLNKHPEMFYRDDAEPKVEAFHPLEEFRADMDFTEADINWCIEHNDCPNAIIAYNAMVDKGIKLSDETLLQFFEMICFTNEESVQDFFDKETSRLQLDTPQHLADVSWKTNGLASKIFAQIKDDLDPPRVYSAMIAGLVKYRQFSTAKQVFDDFAENHRNTGLYQTAYSSLLKSVPALNSSVVTAHKAVDDIVNHMEANLVMPDLQIFNSILNCYSIFTVDEAICAKSLNLVKDMRTLDISPSLATYANLIRILCGYKKGTVFSEIIKSIISHINSDNNFVDIKDERDSESLTNIMLTIANRLHNLSLAHQLHKIYLKKPNLFKNQKMRNRYLNDYFKLIVTTDTVENALDFYNTYVPLHFQPSADTYEALAEILELYQASDDMIKKIGNDLIDFNVAKYVKNDAIFRKNPDYVKAIEENI